jgi:excisionase family DNA binding protein
LSLRRITRAIASGELASVKIGRRRVITRAALENYVRGVDRSDITQP